MYNNDTLNTLNLIYYKVLELNNGRFIVQENPDSEFMLLDKFGNVIRTLSNFYDFIQLGNSLIGKNNNLNYQVINQHSLNSLDDSMEFTFFTKLDSCEAAIVGEYNTYGVLGSNGKLLTPMIYNFIGECKDDTYKTKLRAIYYHGLSGTDSPSTSFYINVNKEGTSVDRIFIMDLSTNDGEKYQIECVSFDESKSSNKSIYQYGSNKLVDDTMMFNLKFRPARYGIGLGNELYDGVLYDRCIASAGYYKVYNNHKDTKYQGIVDSHGKVIIKADKYTNIQFMGNEFFACYNPITSDYVIIKHGDTLKFEKKCIGFNPNNPLPILNPIFDDGSSGFLDNKYTIHKDLISSLTIYKYCRNGVINNNLNKIDLYGSIYYVDNTFQSIHYKNLVDLDVKNDSNWMPLSIGN